MKKQYWWNVEFILRSGRKIKQRCIHSSNNAHKVAETILKQDVVFSGISDDDATKCLYLRLEEVAALNLVLAEEQCNSTD